MKDKLIEEIIYRNNFSKGKIVKLDRCDVEQIAREVVELSRKREAYTIRVMDMLVATMENRFDEGYYEGRLASENTDRE